MRRNGVSTASDERDVAPTRRDAVPDIESVGVVGIIGLGLIGGSVAHDLAAAGVRVIGFDRDPDVLDEGVASGVVQARAASPLELVGAVDVLLIAAPLDAALALLDDVARSDAVRTGRTIVMDVGSTKKSIVDAANATSLRTCFVGAHPLAGDHRSGFAAARPHLFRRKPVYLCPAAATSETVRQRAVTFWQLHGALPHVIDAAEHDELLAWTSHLPQAVSSALAHTLDGAGISHDQLGPGGRDATRLAASDPDLWTTILLDNARHVSDALQQAGHTLDLFRRAIDARDHATLRRLLTQGRALHARTGGAEPAPGGTARPPRARQASMRISSSAFEEGAEIPTRFTCDGEDVSPPLAISGVPENARTLALIVDDPDAPVGTFVHWLLWNLPPGVRELPEDVPPDDVVTGLGDAHHGITDFKRVGYGGPCPPDRRHTYRFMLYALDTALDLEAGANRKQLDDAMKGHIITEAILRATYDRPNR